jgi:hypothetical protein
MNAMAAGFLRADHENQTARIETGFVPRFPPFPVSADSDAGNVVKRA